ncbi:MAG: HPF/RaiA family ribosome-associated protein [Candidatus Pacebacteria bacterium]|nr:HPF/RaiA family ribosome-associated protein [Candidatus Paceibacterota bacterium]
MKFIIKSKTMIIDNRIEEFIHRKIGVLAKIIPHSEIIPVDVDIEKSNHHQKGDVYKVVVQFLLKGNRMIRAVGKKETFNLAISKVREALEVQIKKYDHKPESRRKKTLKVIME